MYYFTEKLKNRMERITDYPITIIEAGSGCGKTTAVHEYFLKQTHVGYRHLYYTCMGEEAERTWKGICDEFSKIDDQIGQYLYTMELTEKGIAESVAAQINYMTCEEPTIFCIDNYQLWNIAAKDMLLHAFSLHHCENLHIVILTQPYIHIEKAFFTRYPYYYISSDAFSFEKTDIDAYFRQEGIRLKADELDRIWKVTEGYTAALQLQMDSWKQHGSFVLSNQIFDLMERILWRDLSDTEKGWLLWLSVSDDFTMKEGLEICAVKEKQMEFRGFLARMDFISQDTDSRRYQLHHLLLQFVRDKFSELSTEELQTIRRRTAKAKELSGEYLTAAHLYCKCGDMKALIDICFDKDDRVELVRMDDGEIVKQLIRLENRQLLWEKPELILSLTLELYVQGQMMLCKQYLEVVNEIMKEPGNYGKQRGNELMGEFCLMQSFLVYNDVQSMCSYHKQAWDWMKRPTKLYSLHTAWTFGMPSVVAMFWRKSGELEQVFYEVREGMPLYYQLSEGNGMGAHHAMEGERNLLLGDDKKAEKCFREALCDAEKLGQDSICYCAYLWLAKIAIFRGSVSTYAHMQENIDDRPYLGKESSSIFTTDVCKGCLAILLDQFEEVPEWLWDETEVRNRSLMPALPYVHSIYGRLFLEQMKRRTITYDEFAAEQHRLIAECHQFHMLLPEIYAWIYLSAGADMNGDRITAKEYLQHALDLCFKDRVLFPFVENYSLIKYQLDGMVFHGEGKEMNHAIIQAGESFLKGKKKILEAIHVTGKTLTVREKEIAGLLKARWSVKEIAAKLSISPSTVSNTMQSIYSKLGIHTKRELYYREDV